MTTVDIDVAVPRTTFPQRYDRITAQDFETASIRSTAPSYISEAPSYHSENAPNEPAPPYSPRENSGNPTATRRSNPAAQRPSRTSGPAFIPPPSGLTITRSVDTRRQRGTSNSTAPSDSTRDRSNDGSPSPTGLPPIRPIRAPVNGSVPNLAEFRIPTITANPSARHYVRVAQRRAQAAAAAADAGFAVRMLLDRVEEEESRRFRPLEDPHLVGEDEARRARERRVAREEGIQDSRALEREGRRWDWFLGQVREWDDRDRRSNSPAGPMDDGSVRAKRHRDRLGIFGRR
ncbi:hypothetical protein MKZ38_010036 [Zalerion maritima]|uniref:Uncharacterized protein n=1 Tax=Zalerion maritima TaxID=339359 RepID=A0AAD5WT72_9PEZI|nr:hypothetical protein MKZ38_010036 [Zalerion maritima]